MVAGQKRGGGLLAHGGRTTARGKGGRLPWQARSPWRKEAGWLGHSGQTAWFTDRQQHLAQRQKKLAGGSPGRRIERREKRLDHGARRGALTTETAVFDTWQICANFVLRSFCVRFTSVQRSFYDYDCDTSINGQL